MKNIEYILNDCLNKAMCQKGRIQQPDSNKIAEFVSKYVEAKKLNLHAVVKQSELLSKRPNTSSTWECFSKSEKQQKGNV